MFSKRVPISYNQSYTWQLKYDWKKLTERFHSKGILWNFFFILFTNWMRYANLIFAISLRESRIEKHWGVLTVFLLLKSFGFLHHILVHKRGCCSSFSLFGEPEMQQIKLNSLRISYFSYKQVRWSTCYIFLLQHRPRVPFLEITCNLTVPKPYSTIKI